MKPFRLNRLTLSVTAAAIMLAAVPAILIMTSTPVYACSAGGGSGWSGMMSMQEFGDFMRSIFGRM